ncbi:MAG: 2-C-methyl-D-erythritol 4-phosphate cytidylyltransferase [Clostridia bacterium]|nr:2-C-methyl-D-erythritol 4-phosphate cytidylyltransferase [Clostridia bacterium]
MISTKPKLNYSVCDDSNNGIPVIIVAAGESHRMNGIDKQLLNIAGIPVIARTLLCFERSDDISRIILVTREQSVKEMQLIAEKYMIGKLSDIVIGADTRQKSVLSGLERLKKDEDKILISDGARAFVTKKLISDCVTAIREHDGCVAAIKVTDTVKNVSSGRVEGTIDRTSLYLAQTPQGITVSLYKKVLEGSDNLSFTDDASVLEAGNCDVVTVSGDIRNIKITTPDDIKIAEVFAKEF